MQRAAYLLVMLAAAGPAWGQSQQAWQRPVDQTVEDWSALSASQRVIDPGLARFSDRVNLFQPLNPFQLDPHGQPGSHSYIYEAPGLRAWIGSPQYLSQVGPDPRHPEFRFNVSPIVDGQYLSLIPAGTVFDLTLPSAPPTDLDLDPASDPRIDHRIDRRIDRQIHAQPIRDQPLARQPMPPPIVGFGNVLVIDESTAAPPRAARRPAPPAEPSPADEQIVDQSGLAQPSGDEGDDAAGQ